MHEIRCTVDASDQHTFLFHLTMASRILFFLVSICLVFVSAASNANVVDRSVAIVNNDTITLSEVNELGRSFFKKVTEETPADRLPEALQQARNTVIDKLIDKKLLVQEAKKLGIQVSDQEVDNALQRVLANNKATMEQFHKELLAMGMTEKQYKEELRDQILSSKLINHEVRTKVVIPEEKILEYYQSNYTRQVGGGELHLQQIGCTWGEPLANGVVPSQDDAKEKIRKAYEKAKDGDDFNELAKKYSDLPSAEDGGDLGTFQLHELAPAMQQAVAQLKSGEISPVVQIDNGYHFFKLVSSQGGATVSKADYEAVKEEIRERLYKQAMEARFKDWVKSIRDKAYIKIL
ncbi:SurA N-terminal domain-containing protein [Desulfobulbus propionicus]|nr:SurA N-terminal domain-containing protein [Desulfobulbus propionicus]